MGSACDSLDLAFIFDNDSPRELHLVLAVLDSSQLQLAGLRGFAVTSFFYIYVALQTHFVTLNSQTSLLLEFYKML